MQQSRHGSRCCLQRSLLLALATCHLVDTSPRWEESTFVIFIDKDAETGTHRSQSSEKVTSEVPPKS